MGIKNQLKLENKKEIIIEKINNDISLTQIAKDLNSSVTAVKAVVTKYLPNKKFTSSKPKLYNLKEEVYLDYLRTPNLKKLALKYDCNICAIKTAILLINPTIKFSYNRGNENYFNIIDNPNKAYIAGFIAADGALVKSTQSNSIALTITIHKKDKEVLEFIKKELGCDNPIKELKRDNLIRFTISSKQLSTDLINLGIVPNKSLILKDIYNNIPKEFQKSFLLGYFDGDGCIHFDEKRNKYTFSVRGTAEFLEGYNKIFNLKQPIRKYDSTSSIHTARKEYLKRFYTVYTENPPDFYFQRKYIKFLNFIEKNCQDKTISSSST